MGGPDGMMPAVEAFLMPDWFDVPVWLIAFLIAFPIGTLVEYWGHRMMHAWLLKKKHAEHHRDGWGQGWLGEFYDYVVGTIYMIPLGFLHSVEAGFGFGGGALLFAAFAAYSHQLQHEKPELCFWMSNPVHYLHHYKHMWKKNFGISCDIWDRVFGTYQKVEWARPPRGSWLGLFNIHWLRKSPPDVIKPQIVVPTESVPAEVATSQS